MFVKMLIQNKIYLSLLKSVVQKHYFVHFATLAKVSSILFLCYEVHYQPLQTVAKIS
jgi:hypothetical protein